MTENQDNEQRGVSSGKAKSDVTKGAIMNISRRAGADLNLAGSRLDKQPGYTAKGT